MVMAAQQRLEKSEVQTEPTGATPVLLRLIWMVLGNMALLVSATLVAKGTAPVVTDFVFFAVVGGMIAARYVDITMFKGQTSECEPATLAHWRRYAILLALVATAMWALARVAASRGWMM